MYRSNNQIFAIRIPYPDSENIEFLSYGCCDCDAVSCELAVIDRDHTLFSVIYLLSVSSAS